MDVAADELEGAVAEEGAGEESGFDEDLEAVADAEDEAAVPVYGRRPERDQVGVMERIGPRRWRLALPFPRRDPILERVDIVR